MVVVYSRAPTGSACIRYVIYQCALLRMQYVYCTTCAKTWKTSRVQQGKTRPNFLTPCSSGVHNRDEAAYPAGNILQKNFPRYIPSEQRTPPVSGDGEQQAHGSFDLACCHNLPNSTAVTRNDISTFTRHHKALKQHQRSSMCPKGVCNSLIILYNTMQIYLYFKDCSL